MRKISFWQFSTINILRLLLQPRLKSLKRNLTMIWDLVYSTKQWLGILLSSNERSSIKRMILDLNLFFFSCELVVFKMEELEHVFALID